MRAKAGLQILLMLEVKDSIGAGRISKMVSNEVLL